MQNDKKLEDDDTTHKRRRKGTHYLAEVCFMTYRGGCCTFHKSHECRNPTLVTCQYLPPLSRLTLLATQQLSCQSAPLAGADGGLQENKDRSMATLLAKFEENSSSTRLHNKVRGCEVRACCGLQAVCMSGLQIKCSKASRRERQWMNVEGACHVGPYIIYGKVF